MRLKNLLCSAVLATMGTVTQAQLGVQYDPSVQDTKSMQYFKPKGDLFVGDCIPFSKDGVYYYYWLLDSAHHRSLNGLGGHQWALSKSSDLKNWEHFPLALRIDEAWEKSICTGSVVFYKGKYYAFYATRLLADNKVNEQLSYAISDDGIHFEKQKPNPFYTSAPGYSKRDFRDPKVFVDEKSGEFHLFVSSWQENTVMKNNGGALVHLSSKDLKNWTVQEPILTGQPSVPECPDYFLWKGWYYLVYSDGGNTYYVKSKKPYGPWEAPRFQAFNEDWSNVLKTATFKNDRLIAAAWVPNRSENKDNNGEIFGGNSLFREVLQESDGTLITKFPPEMIPETAEPLKTAIVADLASVVDNTNGVVINSPGGVGTAHIENVPLNCRITLVIEPQGPNEEYGIYLRSKERADGGYRLRFSADNKTVKLGNTTIEGVDGLEKAIQVDIVMKDGIIDVDVNHQRTIVNRTYEQNGGFAWFYAKHGKVNFKSITIYPLKEN